MHRSESIARRRRPIPQFTNRTIYSTVLRAVVMSLKAHLIHNVEPSACSFAVEAHAGLELRSYRVVKQASAGCRSFQADSSCLYIPQGPVSSLPWRRCGR